MKRRFLTGTRGRISGGFGIVLVLFSVVQLFDLRGQSQLGEHFASLKAVANESVQTTELKNVLADVELSIRDYLLHEDNESRRRVDARYQAFKTALEAAQNAISDAHRREAIAAITGLSQTYWSAFLAASGRTERKQYIINQILEPMGARLRDRLSAIEKAAGPAAPLAGAVRERMLLTQYLVGRYVVTLADADGDKAGTAWQSVLGTVDDLDKAIGDDVLRRQFTLLKAFLPSYTDGLSELKPTIDERSSRLQELAALGDSIRAAADGLRASATADEAMLSDGVADTLTNNRVLAIGATFVTILLGFLFAMLTTRGVVRPLAALTRSMDALARGETAQTIPGRDRTDELGAMAQSVQVFRDAMVARDTLERAQGEEHAARERRAARLESHIAAFESAVGDLIDSVSAASQQLNGTAEGMARIAEEASGLAEETAAAVEKAAFNVRSVADNTESLTQSITEIARQSTRSSDMTRQAVEEAERTNHTVEGLSGAAQRIGDVIKLITGIASQTNLLALNATIEAARAGEAGKGFTVVASEVKALAHQTAGATEDIAQQVAAIQGVSGDAVAAIRSIGASITSISTFTTAIAATVEQQHAAADTIAQSVRAAAGETERIATNIVDVNRAAQRSGEAAGALLAAAAGLTGQSDALRGEIRRFLESIRQA